MHGDSHSFLIKKKYSSGGQFFLDNLHSTIIAKEQNISSDHNLKLLDHTTYDIISLTITIAINE